MTNYIYWSSQNSVDINAESTDTRATPLHLAAYQGHWNVLECLVGWGAMLNVMDKNGDTPLHFVIASTKELPVESTQLKKVSSTSILNFFN